MQNASLADTHPPTAAAMSISEVGKLFRQKSFVAGQWRDADSGETIDVFNPAHGSRIGSVPAPGVAETRRAIPAATRSLAGWRKLLPQERADILHRWYELILENRESLATLMTSVRCRHEWILKRSGNEHSRI